MPIYEYKCGKCGRISEFLETAGKPVSKKCMHCGSDKLEKRFSTFSARMADGQSKRCYGCSDDTCPHSQH